MKALADGNVVLKPQQHWFRTQIEVLSLHGQSHLGDLFMMDHHQPGDIVLIRLH